MKFLNDNLPKGANVGIVIIALLSVMSFFKSCGSQKEDSRMRKELVLMQAEMDSLQNHTYNKEEFDLRMKLLSLETSKNILYDQNAIVRTAVRPDDKMDEYDKEIEKVRKQLQDLEK